MMRGSMVRKSKINMEETIKRYIDSCIGFVSKNSEYLMYVPFWEGSVEKEMSAESDLSVVEGKPVKVNIVQPKRTGYIVNIVSEKDKMWKVTENAVSDEQILKLEKELSITLPKSYKMYLKYKHYYEIFRDLNIFLYPKPIHSWYNILLKKNIDNKEIILDKGYFAIGRFSDYGEIALKLNNNDNEEGEVVMFDHETGEADEILSENFISLLNSISEMPEPETEELKAGGAYR